MLTTDRLRFHDELKASFPPGLLDLLRIPGFGPKKTKAVYDQLQVDSLEKLEAMTSVCSVGLDMIAIPGDTPAETIAAIIADEATIGVINNKTTGVRLIPVPGAKVGDRVEYGGLFGGATIMDVRNTGASAEFVNHGGRIPAPIQSLRN